MSSTSTLQNSTPHFRAHTVGGKQIKPELRVLQVFATLGMGGAETWLMSLLRYFKEREDELSTKVTCDVLLTSGMKGLFDDQAAALGANLYYVPYSKKKLVSFLRKFRRILADGRYNVIHDHQDYTAGWHFLLGTGLLPPIRISHVHNPYFCVEGRNETIVGSATLKLGRRFLSGYATHVAGTSREILTKYGFDHPSFSQLDRSASYCGFDVERFNGNQQLNHDDLCREFGWDPNARILLFIGRLDTNYGNNQNQKNPQFAIEVAKACITKDVRVRMIVAGGGLENMHELSQQVRTWGLANEIRFVGLRTDVSRLMLGSDLLLFPSQEEGLGMVAVEAQAAGLRVLASDLVPEECKVVYELVQFESLMDGAASWSDQALTLMDLEKANVAKCNNLVKVSPFSIDNSAANLVRLYSA